MNEPLSIFGGTGYVGSHFCRATKREYTLIPRAERAPTSNQVVYFISTTHNYHVFDDVHQDVNTNLTVLLEVLKNVKAGSVFNFISSWFVYGDTELPAHEGSICNPKGFYSITKRCAEQLLISYCETFNIHYRILRICNVYGGKDPDASKKKNALHHLIDEMRNHRPIKLYYDGHFYRDYMHVEDAARAIDTVIAKGDLNTVYNVGTGDKLEFRKLILMARELLHSNSEMGSMEPPAFHKVVQVKDFYMNVDKLNKLGFKPAISMEKGLPI